VLVVLIPPVVIAIVISAMALVIVAIMVAIVATVFLGLAGRQVAVAPAGLLAVMFAVVVVAVMIAVLVSIFIFVFVPVVVTVFVAIPVMVAVVVVMREVITIIAIVIVFVAVVLREGSCRQQGTAQTCHNERFQRWLKHTSSLVEMRLEAAGGLNSLKQLYRRMLPASTPSWYYNFRNRDQIGLRHGRFRQLIAHVISNCPFPATIVQS